MKIAVTYENGQIFQHFGHTEYFKIYEIEDGTFVKTEVLNTGSSGHSALADWLKDNNVEKLICDGIGSGAIDALGAKGIEVLAGVSGNADSAVIAYINGKLDYSSNANCTHHDDANHSCGEHGCK